MDGAFAYHNQVVPGRRLQAFSRKVLLQTVIIPRLHPVKRFMATSGLRPYDGSNDRQYDYRKMAGTYATTPLLLRMNTRKTSAVPFHYLSHLAPP